MLSRSNFQRYALIEITDEDSDFKLSFVEFYKSLDAGEYPLTYYLK